MKKNLLLRGFKALEYGCELRESKNTKMKKDNKMFSLGKAAVCLVVIWGFSVGNARAAASYDGVGIASAVLNSKTGKIVDGKNTGKKLPVASLTKLMTALVLLDEKINFSRKVTITSGDLNYVNDYINKGDSTSKVNLRAGDQVKMGDLWNAMLVASSNESAVALVRNSGISKSEFVEKMNVKARALGLKETEFKEYTGIDSDNISTPEEMAVIAREAFAKKKISSTSTKKSYTMKVLNRRGSVVAQNRNNSLLQMDPKGMKIGYLTEAKNNVAMRFAGKKDGIVVVMHAESTAERNAEVKRLKKILAR